MLLRNEHERSHKYVAVLQVDVKIIKNLKSTSVMSLHWHLLLGYEYKLIWCLKHLLEIDQSRVLESELEHHHLPQDLLPAWLPFPPLPDKFGGHFFTSLIVDAFLYNSKLSPAKKKKHHLTINSETTNKLSTEIVNNNISSNILKQRHFNHVDVHF